MIFLHGAMSICLRIKVLFAIHEVRIFEGGVYNKGHLYDIVARIQSLAFLFWSSQRTLADIKCQISVRDRHRYDE